jgi:hypothetical protein
MSKYPKLKKHISSNENIDFNKLLDLYCITHYENLKLRQQDEKINLLIDFSGSVSELEANLTKVSLDKKGTLESKKNWDFLSLLKKVNNQIGIYYFEALSSKRKYQNCEKELLQLRFAVAQLQKEKEILQKQLEF